MVLPHLEYAPVPSNAMSQTNKCKLQAVQNKALRWVNGDRPPYNSTIRQLHQQYNMTPLNIRNHEQAMKVWRAVERECPEKIERWASAEGGREHGWWRLAQLGINSSQPTPYYARQRRNVNEEMNDSDLDFDID